MATLQPGQPKRVLSLDGGGVRGLSTILILKRLMRRYNEGTGEAERHPWEVFDMICGTSTGGIIAIMLGRLRMTLEECEDAYLRLAEKIFSPRRSVINPLRGFDYFQANGKFDHKVLEDAVCFELKRLAESRKTLAVPGQQMGLQTPQTGPQAAQGSLVASENNESQSQEAKRLKIGFGRWFKQKGGNATLQAQKVGEEEENLPLWEPDSRCKVFVCTVRQKSIRPTALRSYAAEDNMDSIYKICKVWEAVRATSAATTFFDPIKIGKYGETFVDGGLKHNNPIAMAKVEARRLWAEQELVITSVGTGTARIESLEGNLITIVQRLKAIATDCDDKWESFVAANKAMRDEGRLFRFTATGLEDVVLDEAGQKGLIAERTNSYLENGSTKEELEKCKEALLRQGAPVVKNEVMTFKDIEPSIPLKVLPFGRNKHFVGRQVELDKLCEIFCGVDSGEDCQRAALDGLGGIGKTQVALEFAFKIQELSSKHSVFWVQAIDEATFENSYRKIGEKLQIPGLNDNNADIKNLVKEWLSEESAGKWLLIIDNADDSKMFYDKKDNSASLPLSKCLPFSNLGGILFTTRDHDAATRYADSDVVDVGEMSPSESKELLCKSLQNKQLLEDRSGTDTLLTLLVNLPLAIMQAAAYLNSKNTTISQYLDLYKESSKNEITLLQMNFDGRGRYQEMNNAVATTWVISFEQIQRQDRLAADYMRFIACIKEQDIPWDLLPELDSLQRNHAFSTLKGFGFLKEQGGGRFYNMHRLVHLAAQNWMRREMLLSTWTETALKRLVDVIPYGGHEQREKWTAYIPHGLQVAYSLDLPETLEEERLDLLDRVGSCHSSTGQYSAAAEVHGNILKSKMRILGNEHPSTLLSMNEVGLALSNQGKYTEAEKLYQETLALREKVSGKEHPETLITMNNLGQALSDQGKYTEAEKLHQETLALKEKLLGKEHPSTLVSMNEVGLALSNQGKYTEAEKLYQETLALREKVSGKEHPETLITMNNLGQALSDQGKYTEAEKLHQETLALKEKLLGKEHPSTLVSMNEVGLALSNQGKYTEAEKLYQETLALREKVSGKEHPETLIIMNNLGQVLSKQGKYTEAEKLYQETLALREKVSGKEHPETLIIMNNLGQVLSKQGKYTEAEKLHRETLALREKVSGKEHPSTLVSMNNLGQVLSNQGKYTEAEKLYQETLALREKVSGKEHPETLIIMNNLGQVLSKQGKYTEAEKLHRETLALREKVLGKEHPSTLVSMNEVGLALSYQGKYTEAEKLLREALVLSEKVLGKEHRSTLIFMNNLNHMVEEQKDNTSSTKK